MPQNYSERGPVQFSILRLI